MWGRDRWHRRLAGMKGLFTNDEGQALIEYALVLALIAIVSIAALKALGLDISILLNRISSQMASVNNP
jgi:pilus assembly protein Flp/PilA